MSAARTGHTPTGFAPATLSPIHTPDSETLLATGVPRDRLGMPLPSRTGPPTPSNHADTTLPPPPHTRCWAYLSQMHTHQTEITSRLSVSVKSPSISGDLVRWWPIGS